MPFYKASFVWLMKRQTTDYYLRVVVPLAFILVVAYLSIFIPQTHFEAIVTIQVTALLSSVALYLALPKLDADSTTCRTGSSCSCYMAVSLMIGISIFRISRPVARRPWLGRILAAIYVILIPALVTGMGFYMTAPPSARDEQGSGLRFDPQRASVAPSHVPDRDRSRALSCISLAIGPMRACRG